jgi:predicted transcriptional regulator
MTYVILIYISSSEYTKQWIILITPCEIAARSIIPAVKAMLAKELIEKQGLKQNEIAVLLGVSQSAISKYAGNIRGYTAKLDNLDELRTPLNNIMELLLTGATYERTEFRRLFCEACTAIRRTGLMCEYCRRSDPTIEISECNICLDK